MSPTPRRRPGAEPSSLTRLARLTVAAGLVVGAVGTTGAAAEPDVRGDRGARAADGISLVGNGFGHGHGMSQNGAQLQARQGRSYEQILSFYYPGLTRSRLGGTVSVLVSADTTGDVVVSRRSGLEVASPSAGKRVALARTDVGRWRITPADRGRTSRVSFYKSRRWHAWRTLPGQAQFQAGGAPITLHLPGGATRAYRGVLRSAAPTAGSDRDTVNVVSLDTYLRGVVPREVPALWEPAAVQAQAVAARTYAAFERRRPLARHYQICDTTACQVYGGATDEHPASDRAVRATKAQVLTSGGQPAFTQFSASNGGWTSAGGFSYLPAKQDGFDTSYRGWTDSVTAAEVERALPAIGTFRRVAVTERDGNGQWGGRVLRIEVVGSRTSTTISGESFRSYFGLNSTWFDLR